MKTDKEEVRSLRGLEACKLLDALIGRRSHRFARGMRLNGGPLAFTSAQSPQPLSLPEEAALAFAACGLTGYALAELPYQTGHLPEAGSGGMMFQFVGRTIASADALHTVILFVINDEGVWMIKRPQDFPRAELPELVKMANDHRLVEIYQRSRVRISDVRLDVPREIPFVPAFNKWSANLPGTSYFLPVNELTGIYINILLTAFNEEFGYFVLDDRNRFRPAGIRQFSRSRGGHLNSDPASGRVGTISSLESWLYEFTAIEQGALLQNLALMTQALGLGGFPHFAAHPFIWFQVLGFRMHEVPFSKTAGTGRLMNGLLKALGKDVPIPTAVGLEQDGRTLIKPFCPPYYRNMEEAVLALVDCKYGQEQGSFRDGGAATGWKEGASVQAAIPPCSEQAIAATVAYCDYIYDRYGRFPSTSGPFRSILAHQAHHLDLDFYDRFYRPEVLSTSQRRHEALWHGHE